MKFTDFQLLIAMAVCYGVMFGFLLWRKETKAACIAFGQRLRVKYDGRRKRRRFLVSYTLAGAKGRFFHDNHRLPTREDIEGMERWLTKEYGQAGAVLSISEIRMSNYQEAQKP